MPRQLSVLLAALLLAALALPTASQTQPDSSPHGRPWQGKWIWPEGDPAPRNPYTCFRKTFYVSDAGVGGGDGGEGPSPPPQRSNCAPEGGGPAGGTGFSARRPGPGGPQWGAAAWPPGRPLSRETPRQCRRSPCGQAASWRSRTW